ncbi:hypothetical protein MNBD_ALPHA12-2271 [hydrothermal vent metagenome]|uniref:Uncharacterized protein n=1 Tax=hydrothermal vent metagenome TaxID=652676 RepID=A0A3B0UDU5_9ZZZZ
MAPKKADPDPTLASALAPGRTRLVAHSAAFLPEGYALARKPRFGWRSRPESFYQGFEKRALFYDVFRHADGEQVLLVGPPPRNLLGLLKRAHYSVKGNKTSFKPKFFISQSVMIMTLKGVPKNADILDVRVDDLEFALPIGENFARELAGRRVLFTMSKNNPLPWIKAWAHYHQRFHDVDAVVLIDNGSSDYPPEEIARTLEKTRVKEIMIISWPYIYGAIDRAVIFNPYWTHFLQIAGLALVLRRFVARAEGILNCDIDELVAHRKAPSIFSALQNTPQGLLAMNGSWVEPLPLSSNYGDHRDFIYRVKDQEKRVCHERKWLLDPRQDWVQNLAIHPYMHWIKGRPRGSKFMSEDAFFWHFKGINTNWKVKRNKITPEQAQTMEPDPELGEIFSRWPDIK